MSRCAARLAAGVLVLLGAGGAAAPAAPASSQPAASAAPGAAALLEVAGIELAVDELAPSIAFYADGGLGFELLAQGADDAVLRRGGLLLVLRRVSPGAVAMPAGAARVYCDIEVKNLKRTLESFRGVQLAKVVEGRPLPAASGVFLTIRDPAGHVQRLVEPASARPERPTVRDVAVEVADLAAARHFYQDLLGLPESASPASAPPRQGDGQSGGLTIELRQAAAPTAPAAPEVTAGVLVLRTADLSAALAALTARGAAAVGKAEEGPLGRRVLLRGPADPSGLGLVELVEPRRDWATAPALPRGAAAAAPGLVLEPHEVRADDGSAVAAELGRLTVPENRARPDGPVVELALLRFRSTSRHPGAPIVYLAGGPGGSGTADARGARLRLLLALREVADVIALDQRGTGMSRPELTCGESWSIPLTRPADPEDILTLAGEHSWACARALRRAGIDLAAYNSNESADDIEDLRRALGAPRVSLLGYSYGTHLAMAALRRHPAGIAAVVLAGYEGPDELLRLPSAADEQVGRIGEVMAAAAVQAGQAPTDLAAALRGLYAHLDEQPETVLMNLRWSRQEAQVTVGRFDLQWMVAQALTSRAGIAKLPGQIAAMQRRDYSSLGAFALAARHGWLGSATPYAIQCSSGASPERLRRIESERAASLLGRALDFPFPDICEAWAVPDLGAAYREPFESDVPALFIAGSLDVRTPASDAEEARRRFARGSLLLLDGAGHGDDLLLSSPEIGAAMLRFLRGQVVADRTIELPPLAFEPDRPAR